MMKSRKLGIGLLLMLAVVVTTGTFAYWSSSVASDDDVKTATVTIGEGGAVTTTVTLGALSGSNSGLVPTGQGVNGTDDTVNWTIPVEWDAAGTDAAGHIGTLAVTATYAMSNSTLTSEKILKK